VGARPQLPPGALTHAGYAAVFFGVWWAWVNFTWFASAYDTDVPYRLLTLLQMAGVLVFAAGIPAAFEHFDFATAVTGYVIMRLAPDYERLAAHHETYAYWSMIIVMTRCLARQPAAAKPPAT
jgi:low temperature requirement protein LtrA